jgi:NADPH-dependent 7-cyano-7-deazaguanine reductase QueF-like protein
MNFCRLSSFLLLFASVSGVTAAVAYDQFGQKAEACGIVGFIGKEPAVNFLLEGLHILQNRGYDSAGIATLHVDAQGRQLVTTKVSCLILDFFNQCLTFTSELTSSLRIFFLARK